MGDLDTPQPNRVFSLKAVYQFLKSRPAAVRATAWHFSSNGVSGAMYFASHLLLARLLAPEAFGVMVMASLVTQGLAALSNLGIKESIVQHPRGEEPTFLRTAWTLEVLRGGALWLVALILTWPMAAFYEEPRLRIVLPLVALGSLADRLMSTQVDALERRLEFGRVVMVDLSSQFISIVMMLTLAYFSRTVWPLVVGVLAYSLVSTALTHLVLGGPPMRFELNRQVVHDVFRFGKWIFLSSILVLLGERFDRLALGKVMTISEVGAYGIAYSWSRLVVSVVNDFTYSILFPLYARSIEKGRSLLVSRVFRVRVLLMGISLPPLWILALFGSHIIGILYDDRYQAAGWMLQVLAVGAIPGTLLAPVESVLIASGDSFRHMLLKVARSALVIGAVAVGGYCAGANGVILGFVLSNFLYYPIFAVLVRRYGAWMPWLDLVAFLLSGGVLGVGYYLTF